MTFILKYSLNTQTYFYIFNSKENKVRYHKKIYCVVVPQGVILGPLLLIFYINVLVGKSSNLFSQMILTVLL